MSLWRHSSTSYSCLRPPTPTPPSPLGLLPSVSPTSACSHRSSSSAAQLRLPCSLLSPAGLLQLQRSDQQALSKCPRSESSETQQHPEHPRAATQVQHLQPGPAAVRVAPRLHADLNRLLRTDAKRNGAERNAPRCHLECYI